MSYHNHFILFDSGTIRRTERGMEDVISLPALQWHVVVRVDGV